MSSDHGIRRDYYICLMWYHRSYSYGFAEAAGRYPIVHGIISPTLACNEIVYTLRAGVVQIGSLQEEGPAINVERSFYNNSWWRHQIKTFSALLAVCAGIHRSLVNSPYKGSWRRAFMFSLIYAWINGWVNTSEAGDSRRHRAPDDVTVM